VFRFLEIDDLNLPEAAVVFEGKYPKMPRFTRLMLDLVFAGEIRRLQVVLGRDLSHWTGLSRSVRGNQ
jgi:hypothetical protein